MSKNDARQLARQQAAQAMAETRAAEDRIDWAEWAARQIRCGR